VFIYLIPVITVTVAALFIHERITILTIAGMILTTAGLVISEYRRRAYPGGQR
jgi:drug/metabolite transporter (DMT)-like permease